MTHNLPTEEHPFEPYLPSDAKVLIMGTFPPKANRFSMEFYYPNFINDFWRIMGLIFFGDKEKLVDREHKTFRLCEIKSLLNEKGIAMSDTGLKVRRLRDNASDKFLDIVEPNDLDALLQKLPDCRFVASTGEKAAGVIATQTSTEIPKMGETKHGITAGGRHIEILRMPSTSRAYPLSIEKKAEYYRNLFVSAGILNR